MRSNNITKIITKIIILSLMNLLCLSGLYLSPAKAEDKINLSNPHLKPKKPTYNTECEYCHIVNPLQTEKVKAIDTLQEDIDVKCQSCHKNIPESCSLISTEKTTTLLKSQLKELELPLLKNKISCISCHKKYKTMNTSQHLLKDEYYKFYKAAETINPHKTGVFCLFCHTKEPKRNDEVRKRNNEVGMINDENKQPTTDGKQQTFSGEKYLKYNSDITQLCKSCHNNKKAWADNHPIDIIPSEGKGIKISDIFPLYNGKLTCTTCHLLKCKGGGDNPKFLRGGPYTKRTDACLMCHVREEYQAKSPHRLVGDDGKIIQDSCTYCHTFEINGIKRFGYKAPFKFYCIGCHPNKEKGHPLGGNHTGVFIDTIWKNAQSAYRLDTKEEGTLEIFPLTMSGRIMCSTCHDPHRDKGDNAKLRMNDLQRTCRPCHSRQYEKEEKNGEKKRYHGDTATYSERGLYEGRKECLKCHETKCQLENKEMIAALLKVPGQDWKRACLTCHKSEEYEEKLNVHDHLGVMGNLKEGKCKYCHVYEGKKTAPFSFKAPLKFYCIGCHPSQIKDHPYGKTHNNTFVTRIWMNANKEERLTMSHQPLLEVLPFTNDGRVICATCHDPHEGISTGHKLRLGEENKKLLCSLCHADKSDKMQSNPPF
ncbi:MAG: cytochrome c3 family protein [bacterium]